MRSLASFGEAAVVCNNSFANACFLAGFAIVAHTDIKQRQIVKASRRIWMLRAEHFLTNLQSLLVKGLSFGVPAHIFVELREIIKASRRVGMFHGFCILIPVRLP